MFDTPHPFLQLTLPRVHRTEERLRKQLWLDPQPVEVSFMEEEIDGLGYEEAASASYRKVKLPFHWGRLMHTRWFKLAFPEAADGRTRYLQWHDQGEGTLYLDGVPYYGFDVAHFEVPLPEGIREGFMESLCMQSGLWGPPQGGIEPEGSRLTRARVVARDDDAWECLMDLDVLKNLVMDEAERTPGLKDFHTYGFGNKSKIEVVSPLLRRLLRLLDDAVMAYDEGGLKGLRAALERTKEALKCEDSLVESVLTGHAHIDLVWLWTEANAEYKARHTFSSMNRLLQQYPEFRFAYSQSASYDAIARTSPALLEEVKERVSEGKWEPVGATYVESDTIMACGEALTRSFLVGQERFRDLFGESSDLLWLPDVFGYSGCLPQIMTQCGVDRFFTTKLTWSNINLFPHSSFVWRGVDGSEVLCHVTQGLGYNQNATPKEVRQAAEEYRQSDVHDAYLQPTGLGDGGGGVTPEMCERVRRMKSLAGVPSTRWGRLDEFYDGLEKVRNRLPVYQGELYLEYHRGTVTTHGDLKEAFRGLERALMAQEAANALAGAVPVDDHAWRRLVFSQFHDYIPGSSIHEVYEEGVPELNGLAEKALETAARSLGEGSCLTNLLAMPRKVSTARGVVTLPPLASVNPEELEATEIPAAVSELELKTDRVAATFTERGEIASLRVDGKEVATDGVMNSLTTYPDLPHQFDAWDIDRQTLHLARPVETTAGRVAWTPERGVGLAFERTIGDKSTATIRYWIDPAQPVLQVEMELDWREEHTLLKAMFPTRYRGRYARFGTPFNSVLRSQQPGDLADEAMFESCANRWVTVMDDSQSDGMSVVTENKYGFSCRDGLLGLSLVRSVPVTEVAGVQTSEHTPTLRDGGEREECSDLGRHVIRYAVGGFCGSQPREETAAALADQLYMPVLRSSAPTDAGLLGLEGGESLVPAWSKPVDGGWILRLHEVLGRSGTVSVKLADGWSAEQTRLAEDQADEVSGGKVAFGPYEVVSLRIFRG